MMIFFGGRYDFPPIKDDPLSQHGQLINQRLRQYLTMPGLEIVQYTYQADTKPTRPPDMVGLVQIFTFIMPVFDHGCFRIESLQVNPPPRLRMFFGALGGRRRSLRVFFAKPACYLAPSSTSTCNDMFCIVAAVRFNIWHSDGSSAFVEFAMSVETWKQSVRSCALCVKIGFVFGLKPLD